MLRILVWRLIYHGLCLAKALGLRGKPVHYFAFGANLDPAVLKKRNIEPLTREEYILQNFELQFNHKIPFQGAAMASIEPVVGKCVPGVIYTITKIDALRLDCMESHTVFNRYGKHRIESGTGKGMIFFYKTNCPQEGLKPTKAYVEKLLNGYRLVNHAPAEFLSNLSKTEALEGFLPKDPPEFLVKNYDVFTPRARKMLVWYDKICVRVFASLIFKPSFFEKFFREQSK